MVRAAALRQHLSNDPRAAMAALWREGNRNQGTRTDPTTHKADLTQIEREHTCSARMGCSGDPQNTSRQRLLILVLVVYDTR